MKRILVGFTVLLYCILVLQLLALYFSWYWQFWWFDIVMHILGGVWLAGQGIWFYALYKRDNTPLTDIPRSTIFGVALGTVLIFGILWELFELSIDAFITFKQNEISDTISDIGADVVGGLVTVIFFIWQKK